MDTKLRTKTLLGQLDTLSQGVAARLSQVVEHYSRLSPNEAIGYNVILRGYADVLTQSRLLVQCCEDDEEQLTSLTTMVSQLLKVADHDFSAMDVTFTALVSASALRRMKAARA